MQRRVQGETVLERETTQLQRMPSRHVRVGLFQEGIEEHRAQV